MEILDRQGPTTQDFSELTSTPAFFSPAACAAYRLYTTSVAFSPAFSASVRGTSSQGHIPKNHSSVGTLSRRHLRTFCSWHFNIELFVSEMTGVTPLMTSNILK